jgi:hypothetical protein
LARYELMDVVTELQNTVGRPNGIPGFWLLIPVEANGLPAIDGVAVPVISSAQWARIPQAWLENAHRAGNERRSSLAPSDRWSR